MSGPASHRCMSCSLELRLLLRQRGSRAPTAPWGRVGPEPSQREPGTPEHAQGLTAALSWDGLDPHLSPAPTFRCAGGGPTRPSQQAPTPSPGLLAKSPCQRPGPQSFWSCLGTQLTPCRPDQWHRPPGGVGAYSTTQSAAGTVVRLGRRVSGTEVYLRGVLTVGPGPLMLPAPPQGRTEGGLGRKLVSPTPCLWCFHLEKNRSSGQELLITVITTNADFKSPGGRGRAGTGGQQIYLQAKGTGGQQARGHAFPADSGSRGRTWPPQAGPAPEQRGTEATKSSQPKHGRGRNRKHPKGRKKESWVAAASPAAPRS